MAEHSNEKLSNEDLISEIREVYKYCKSNFKNIHNEKSLEIDINDIIDISHKLHEALLSNPREILSLLEMESEKVFIGQNKKIRLKNLNNPIDIHKIRVKDLNHIFNIKGIIKRITKVIPRTEVIRYRCTTCGTVVGVLQSARKKEEPRRCSCGVKRVRFTIDNEEIKNIQELNLEEIQESLEGKQPQQLRVYLEDELTDGSLCTRLQPGRRIEVIGIIEKLPTFMTLRDEDTNLSEFMLYANNITSLDAEDDLAITPEDEIKIKEIAKDNPLQKLADSLVPEIYGNNMIKKALVLQTVKGVAKEKSDGTYTNENIHVLLCGDVGCISGDSYITLADGAFIKIKELGVHHKEEIDKTIFLDRINSWDKPYAKADTFFVYKNQATKKIITETGKQIICSYNHPLFVKRKTINFKKQKAWVPAFKLRVGDKIKVAGKIPCYKKDYELLKYLNPKYKLNNNYKKQKYCNEDVALLFGYGLGDGCYISKYRTIFLINEEEEDLIKLLSKSTLKNFGVNLIHKIRYPRKSDRIGNRVIKRTQKMNELILNSIEISSVFKFIKEKEIPPIIMKSKNSVVSSFLKGLFEADGCCFVDKGDCPTVILTSINDYILLQTQLLLLRFGIRARICHHNLSIKRAEDIILFQKNIGFLSAKKIKKLKKVYKCALTKNYSLSKKLSFEKIKKIEEGGIQTVYDIHVPNKHRFVSNGIISHNTSKSVTLKSTMLRTPKSRMIVGTKTSKVGISAMCVKDPLTESWALEIGPLILCNEGELCIDELDKLYKEHLNDLLEPMSSSCYDEQTEILTDKGWKFFKDLDKTEQVVVLENGKINYIKPKIFIEKNYDGQMIRIKSEKVDLMVTPNHNLYTSVHKWGREWNPFKLVRAEESYGRRQRLIKNAKWEGEYKQEFILPSIRKKMNQNNVFKIIPEKKIFMDTFLEFLGYYLSEGCFTTQKNISYCVMITQSKKRNKKKFKRCLDKMGFNYSYKNGKFIICNKQLATYLSQFGKAKDKYVPNFVKKLNKKQISRFLEAIMLGDGNTSKVLSKGILSLRRNYYTTSKKLADDVQELLLKIGLSGQIYSRMPITKKIGRRFFKTFNRCYTVSWIIRSNICLLNKKHFSKQDYHGKIYCVEVPNHIIYVRRNGIPIWCGNTVTITKAGIHACLPAHTCMPKGTVIECVEGLKLIEDIKKGQRIWGMDKNFKIIPSEVLGVYKHPIKKRLFEIETNSGKILRVTENHKILSLINGEPKWSSTKNLKREVPISSIRNLPLLDGGGIDFFEGKSIKIPTIKCSICGYLWNYRGKRKKPTCPKCDTSVPIIKTNKHKVYLNEHTKGNGNDKGIFFRKMDDDLAYISGLVFSDGHIKKSQRQNITFNNIDTNLLNKFESVMVQLGLHVTKTTRGDNKNKAYTVHGRAISTLVKNIIKKMPILNKNFINNFICGVIDGDGHVRKGRFQIFTGTKKDTNFIRMLLLKLGITSNTKILKARKKYCVDYWVNAKDFYYLEINGSENCKKIKNKLLSPIKKERLSLSQELEYNGGQRTDFIKIKEQFRKFRRRLNLTKKQLGTNLSNKERKLTRNALQNYLQEIKRITNKEDKLLSKLAFSDILWDEIKNIKSIDEDEVYDLQTSTKNFIADDVIVHNSILASANPIYGNYDLTQPLAKQIDLPSPILNRFDLIFIMIDRPDVDFDSKAVEHIFKSYKEKMVAEIPTELFKKYIIYCKKLKPILADNLINYIQEFYINLREKSNRPDVKSIPVNLRNMEALVKIAESHAKLRLSPIVEIEDLDVAKSIFMFCVKQLGIDDDTGSVDMSRLSEKMPLSKRAKMEKFLEMIYNLCPNSEEIYYSTIIEEGKRLGMKSWEVNIFLETLQKETKIYEPTKGVYKIVE